ncbi:protein kinase [Paraconexibacter antarcticus]|uniref:non-specific serine/threonine protein kinase n=1 Tax=Paraconexibacter antarcticus TaxID=2949664 RepID=A0ABY5DYL7_9ACTN|nr:protein kinase [Paraconexibacter antarcticus]UTI66625.1 protein kinase [Paraconexibacter antarcticus]
MAGSLIVDRYELGERLGVGGMSTVQLALDRRLERYVAVKLLAEHLADDPQFVSRFRREALAAARLVHPNIVQVFDFGLDEASGRHYIVMEVVRGRSGAEILREEGRLSVREAVDLVLQACSGLAYAHRHGVVHRDVKPGNLLRSDDGVVKLADFGIAKATHAEESSITQVGSVLGTASYLAPEQARGEEAGPQADLYALGVVTYQLLSGRLPYEAASLTELALKQQREAPAYLHELDPEIPEELSLAVDRSLALDAADRFGSAEAMARAIADGAQGVADPTASTRAVMPGTEATRVVSGSALAGAAGAAAHTGERTAVSGAQRPPRAPRHPRTDAHVPAAPPPSPGKLSRRERKAQAAAEAAALRAARRRRGRLRRTLGTLLVLVLLAAGGAAAVVATSSDQGAVSLRRITGDRVTNIVDSIDRFVSANTR